MKKLLALSLLIVVSIFKAGATDYYTAAPTATLTAVPGSSQNWTLNPSGSGPVVRVTPRARDNFFVVGNTELILEESSIPLIINNLSFGNFFDYEHLPTLFCNSPIRINGTLAGAFRREGTASIIFTGSNVQLSFREYFGSSVNGPYMFAPSDPSGSQITLMEDLDVAGRIEIYSGANLILNGKKLAANSVACLPNDQFQSVGIITGGSSSSVRIRSADVNNGSQIMMSDAANGSSNFLSSLSVNTPSGQAFSSLKIMNRLEVKDLTLGRGCSIDLAADCRIIGTYAASGLGLRTSNDSRAVFGDHATIRFEDETSTPVDADQPVAIEFESTADIQLVNFTGIVEREYQLIKTRIYYRTESQLRLIFQSNNPILTASLSLHRDELVLRVHINTPSIPREQQSISFLPPGTKAYGEEDFDPMASSSSGLEITYISDNEDVAKVESGKIRITGAGEATITATQTGNSAYEPATPVSHPLTVLRKEISLALSSVPSIDKVYDQSAYVELLPENFVLNGVVADDDITVTAIAAYDNENAGLNKTITAGTFELGGNSAGNYKLITTSANTTGSITKRPVSVRVNLTPAIVKEYDGSTVASLSADNYTIDGLLLNDVIAVTGTAAYQNKNTAPAKQITVNDFILSGPQKDNYTVTNSSALTNGSITHRKLTIKADHKEKVMGRENPELTVSYSGFVSGENNTVLDAQPEVKTTATSISPVGNYPITASGAAAANYDITYEAGILYVKPAGPKEVRLTAVLLLENQPAGALAGTLSSISEDPDASFTYTLENNNTYPDNSFFHISGDRLVCNSVLNYEQKAKYTVMVRSVSQHGTSLDQAFDINLTDVNEVPTINKPDDQVICYSTVPQAVALSNISAGPEGNQITTLTVTHNNDNLLENVIADKTSDGEGILKYTVKAGASGVATLTISVRDNGGTTNGGTDTFSQTFTITVNAKPEVTISAASGTTISKGEVLTLNASVAGNPGNISYSWSDNNGIMSGVNTPNIIVRPAATTTYTLTATTPSGCSEQKSITITVSDDLSALHARNILTPNGDGKNDTWVIDNIDMFPNNEVAVYDRAGRAIFKEKGYKNTWQGLLNGSPLAEGTYYYIVDFTGRGEILKGYITIVRD